MDQGNDSLIRKTKPVHISKRKRGFHSLVPIGRQMSRYFVGSLASAYIMIAWEDKHHNHECPLLLLLSLSIYCWARYHMVWNIPSICWGQLSQLCPLPTSQPTFFGEQQVRENDLMLCEHCSATAKPLMCYQCCFSRKCKAQHHTGCYEGS